MIAAQALGIKQGVKAQRPAAIVEKTGRTKSVGQDEIASPTRPYTTGCLVGWLVAKLHTSKSMAPFNGPFRPTHVEEPVKPVSLCLSIYKNRSGGFYVKNDLSFYGNVFS